MVRWTLLDRLHAIILTNPPYLYRLVLKCGKVNPRQSLFYEGLVMSKQDRLLSCKDAFHLNMALQIQNLSAS